MIETNKREDAGRCSNYFRCLLFPEGNEMKNRLKAYWERIREKQAKTMEETADGRKKKEAGTRKRR